MISPSFSFNESKFIHKFSCDYLNENMDDNIDLKSLFDEYFSNFIDSNSNEYNTYVYHRLRIKYKVAKKHQGMSLHDYLYDILYGVIKTALKM